MRCIVLIPGLKIKNMVGHVFNFENRITYIARYRTGLYSGNSFMLQHVAFYNFKNSFPDRYDLISVFKNKLPAQYEPVISVEFLLDACSQGYLSHLRSSCKQLQVYTLFGLFSCSQRRCAHV